ncbi:unnamed protein product [Notodromas monacha]|uniref:Uncharacterized protein n=1 Tax=Notodromas monacha TaxID=399045 RepID=A0A7R9GCR2_9CRUS|nr:unnamed protein product [Notodromas monacha]CAG0916365.1 unnamed protein product [Notodromas monacha]
MAVHLVHLPEAAVVVLFISYLTEISCSRRNEFYRIERRTGGQELDFRKFPLFGAAVLADRIWNSEGLDAWSKLAEK